MPDRKKRSGYRRPDRLVPLLPRFTLATPAARRGFRRLLWAAGAVYLLTFSSVPVTNIDDQLMLTSAMTFVKPGRFVAPSRFADKKIGGQYFGRQSRAGEVYAKYPIGYPLLLAVFLPVAGAAGRAAGPSAADVVLCLPSMI